jgi:hypothetical protein
MAQVWDDAHFPLGGKPAKRQRYRVLAVDVAEQTERETVYRIKLRLDGSAQPTYLHFVSVAAGKEAPLSVGGITELDERLVDQE